MPAPPDIRKRVARLLAGEHWQDDLHRLFQWLRFQTKGRAPAVKDIGDFVAHRDERKEGLVWECGTDFLHTWLLVPLPGGDQRTLETIRKGAFAALRATGPAIVRATFKKKYRKVSEILKDAFAKIESFDGGKCLIRRDLTEEELRVFKYFTTRIMPRLAFNQKDLFNQFCWCLIENKVLDKSEVSALASASPLIALYAVAHMHGAVLLDGDQPIGQLELAKDGERKGNIAIGIVQLGGLVRATAIIFETELPLEQYLSEDLLCSTEEFAEMRLDLSPEGKLTIV